MRLQAITGSLSSINSVVANADVVAGGIATGSDDLREILGQFAGALKRIHGDADFLGEDRGVFTHNSVTFKNVAGTQSVTMNAGVLSSSDDLRVGGDIKASALKSHHVGSGSILVSDDQGTFGIDDKLFWDPITETLHVQGILAVSSGIDLGELASEHMLFTDEEGKLKTHAGFTFTSSSMTLDLNGHMDLQDTLAVGGVASFADAISGSAGADISGGETKLSSATVSDLTSGRVVLAGAAGSLEDSASLTFDGSALKVVGAVSGSGNFTVGGNLEVNGTATIADDVTVEAGAKLIVQDLAPGRVVYVGANDELVDDAEMTYAAGVLTVSGSTLSKDTTIARDLNVTRNLSAVSGSFSGDVTITGDLTINGTTTTVNTTELLVEDNMVVINKNQTGAGVTAGTAGVEIERGSLDNAVVQWLESGEKFELKVGAAYADLKIDDLEAVDATLSGDLSAVNVSLTGDLTAVSGSLSGDLDVEGDVTVYKLSIDGDTAQRLYIVDTDGSMKDEAKLIFDGSALKVTGAVSGSGNFVIGGTLAVASGADFNAGITVDSIKIDNDVAQRLYIVDGDGSIKDEERLSYVSGSTAANSMLKITGSLDLNGGLFNAVVSGDVLLEGSGASSKTYVKGKTEAHLTSDGYVRINAGGGGVDALRITTIGGGIFESTYSSVLSSDGPLVLSASTNVDLKAGANYVADILGYMDLNVGGNFDLNGDALTLKADDGAMVLSASSHVSMSSALGEVVFRDHYRDSSASWAGYGIKLSDKHEDWTNLHNAFGADISIIGALVAGGAGGKYLLEVTDSAGIGANVAVDGEDFAEVSGASDDFGARWLKIVPVPGAATTLLGKVAKVDVYVNGQLMVYGASYDYVIDEESGAIEFKFALLKDDLVAIKTR
jgi:hypothetical protein